MFHHTLKHSLIFIFCLFMAKAHAESGPGNGTDYVKVLFAESQKKLNDLIQPVSVNEAQSFVLAQDCKDWLVAQNGTSIRWDILKSYLLKMRLSFQTAPCEDSQGRQSSICFYNENPQDPFVVISLQENKNTSSEQAMAMLIHEAGHFVGEMDHLFLDKFGVQIVQSLLAPKSLSVTISSTEVTGNIFAAKEQCEAGTSSQARSLLHQAQIRLSELCKLHRKTCDLNSVLLAYQGRIEQTPGSGFTMRVTCDLTAEISL